MVTYERLCIECFLLERSHPVTERHCVVLAQAFNIAHLEAGFLRGSDDVSRGSEPAVGEDVGIDEGAALPDPVPDHSTQRRRTRCLETDDSVVQKESACFESAIRRVEVHRQVTEADVLDHTNTGDLVVGIGSESAIITNLDAAAICQTCLLDSLARQRCLVFAQRYTRCIDSITLSRVHDQPAPTAADVKKTLTWLQPKLAADQIEFCFLRGVE